MIKAHSEYVKKMKTRPYSIFDCEDVGEALRSGLYDEKGNLKNKI